MRLLKFLVVLFSVLFLQLPAWASCPIPQYELAPIEERTCTPSNGDYGCTIETDEGWVGSWQECLQRGQIRIYRVHLVREYHWEYDYTSFSQYWVYQLDMHDGQGYEEGRQYTAGDMQSAGYRTVMPSEVGSFINPEMQCWCPPEICRFPECIGDQISKKFPFDIFLGVELVPLTCPGVEFYGFFYDLCFIYEALRFLKYPVALALLVKLVMAL